MTWLKSIKIGPIESRLLVFITVIIGIKIFEAIIKHIISKSIKIRDLIFNRYRIEGYWFSVALIKASNQIREFGLIEIEYTDGQLLPSGVLFDCNFRHVGDFSGLIAKFDGRELVYCYKRRVEHEKLEDASGLGSYIFPKQKPYPTSYLGSFFDPKLYAEVLVRGMRITNKKDIKKLKSRELYKQIEVIKILFDTFKQYFPDIHCEVTSSDSNDSISTP